MNKLSVYAIALCLSIIVISSCKKEPAFVNTNTSPLPVINPQTPLDMLIGTWVITQTAEDKNHDNKLQESEKAGLKPGESGTLTFYDDNTGLQKKEYPGVATETKFTWSLQGNDKEIYITKADSENIIFYIEKLSATDLTIMDNAERLDKTWSIMKK